jgi:single-strand DNA-binding protein
MDETTITVSGNLTGAPELRVTPQGVSVCRFTIASTPRFFDKASGEFRDGDSLFMMCTAWRELAEHVAESMKKGQRVIAIGRLTQSTWETEAGEKRSAMALQVDDLGASMRFATVTATKAIRAGARATA